MLGRMRRLRPPWRIALAALAAGLVGLGAAAWLAAPSVGDLQQAVTARDRAAGTYPVALGDVAPVLREAVVATEDERFYRHHGIDVIGVLRALPYDVTHLSAAQGASTLTEQLAKLVYLGGNDHSPWRKLQDMALAVKLEDRYSKEQILAAYLNTAYFGGGATGVAAASVRYFGIPASRLDLAQASLLAGLVQAPGAYDPLLHPAAARARQVAVLRSLVRDGYATSGEAARALRRPLPVGGATLPPVADVRLSRGPAFVWWELAAGAAALLAGLAALLLGRRLALPRRGGLVLLRLAALAVLMAGAAAVVRSFRVV
jgi:membrane peptidoglycan carboxypeptidase